MSNAIPKCLSLALLHHIGTGYEWSYQVDEHCRKSVGESAPVLLGADALARLRGLEGVSVRSMHIEERQLYFMVDDN
jgi:hypothetical protein